MKSGAGRGKPMIRDNCHRCLIVLLLLLLNVAAATFLYYVCKMKVERHLQVCDAKLGPYDYNPLDHTIQGLELNVTLCWK
ncbi:unnamed protein product [Alopecurus aequalis]